MLTRTQAGLSTTFHQPMIRFRPETKQLVEVHQPAPPTMMEHVQPELELILFKTISIDNTIRRRFPVRTDNKRTGDHQIHPFYL